MADNYTHRWDDAIPAISDFTFYWQSSLEDKMIGGDFDRLLRMLLESKGKNSISIRYCSEETIPVWEISLRGEPEAVSSFVFDCTGKLVGTSVL